MNIQPGAEVDDCSKPSAVVSGMEVEPAGSGSTAPPICESLFLATTVRYRGWTPAAALTSRTTVPTAMPVISLNLAHVGPVSVATAPGAATMSAARAVVSQELALSLATEMYGRSLSNSSAVRDGMAGVQNGA